ncbi:hypothetical protein TURU_001342 [Turdus rufiventris]|nr:hypothetical protein TURU_001342 [Turdus rufiventris]
MTTRDPSWLDNLFDGWSFAPWLKELCKIGLLILVVILVLIVIVPCILQCMRQLMTKAVISILVVQKEKGGDIGEYGGGFGGLCEGTGHEILYRAWLPNVAVRTDYEYMDMGYVDMDMEYVTGDSGTDECSCNCSCD